ncbi:MAG: F0F1 ATP synthase subunit A, partial [Planctomycetota bacterium]
LKEIPGKGQALFEMIFSTFDGLVTQSLGAATAPKFLPWIGSLFLFMWLSNMIGLIPIEQTFFGQEGFHDYNHNGVYDPGEFNAAADTDGDGVHDNGLLVLPAFEEPTSDYSVPLGMAILFVLFIGHGSSIRKNGILGYLKGYFDPGGVMGVIMFPLNLIGKIAEIVSISFRLFGNIFGGVVIIIVVGWLLHSMPLMVGLLAFFSIFVGTVQAFVFTMLALTYISLGIADEEA